MNNIIKQNLIFVTRNALSYNIETSWPLEIGSSYKAYNIVVRPNKVALEIKLRKLLVWNNFELTVLELRTLITI